jgi:hypothetical protein
LPVPCHIGAALRMRLIEIDQALVEELRIGIGMRKEALPPGTQMFRIGPLASTMHLRQPAFVKGYGMNIASKPAPKPATKPIAVVQGGESAAIQLLLASFFADWQTRARIVGVIEDILGESCGCAPGHLRNLAGGRSYPIFQNLGPGSTGCSLDGPSLVEAGEQVRRDIARGCDLVVLSKFGKFEAESGSGLLPAFIDAIEAGAMVLTSVAPRFMAAWDQFADPFYEVIPAERPAIEAWWADAFSGLTNQP